MRLRLRRPVRRRRLQRGLVAVAWLALSLLVQVRPVRAELTISLVQPTMTLGNASDGRASMVLQATGLDDKAIGSAAPTVIDMATPEPPSVQIAWEVLEQAGSDKTRAWLLIGMVTGLPRDSRQVRYLEVSFAGHSTALEYTLTNHSDLAFSWTLTGPSGSQHLSPRGMVPITVVVGPVPAKAVTLLRQDVLESTVRTPWASGNVELCRTWERGCDPPSTLAANSANTFYLRARNTPDSYGHFTGTITLAAAEKPGGDTVPLDLSFTSRRRQLAGPFVIALGVFLAWSVSGWGKAKFNRDQLLLSAAVYQEQFRTIQEQLRQLPGYVDSSNYAKTSTLLARLIDSLSEPSLVTGGYVPAIAWAAYAGSATDATKYKAFLDQNGQWLSVARQIQDGFQSALQLHTAGPPDNATQVAACIAGIDALAAPGAPPGAADVAAAITAARLKLAGAVGRLAAPAPTTQGASRSLVVRMERLSTWAWAVAALTTTLIGTYVIVLFDLGFGSPIDYLKCVLWRFGFPIGAAQLGQLTSSSSATTLGISVST